MSTARPGGGRTRRAMCAGMLGLQAIIFLLTTPVLLTLTSVRTGVGLGIGVGLTVACVVVAGLVRRPGGLQLGFVLQGAALALGILIPMMVVLGIVFLGLYTTAYVVGGRIDRERAAREAEAEDETEDDGMAPTPGAPA